MNESLLPSIFKKPDVLKKATGKMRSVLAQVKGIIRRQAMVTMIKGPLYLRNSKRIEIDITSVCNMRCVNCNRSCAQAPAEERMTIAQIKKFIDESIHAKSRWDSIMVIGGEPTLHPDLRAILHMLVVYKKTFFPAADIILATNGSGSRVNEVLQEIPPDVVLRNTKKNVRAYEHYNFNNAPCDSIRYKYLDFENGCLMASHCGTGLTLYGYYTCPIAGLGIDRIFGFDMGRKELPAPDDQMLEQRRTLCRLCGHYRDWVLTHETIISPTWVRAYENYQIRKPELTAY